MDSPIRIFRRRPDCLLVTEQPSLRHTNRNNGYPSSLEILQLINELCSPVNRIIPLGVPMYKENVASIES
ncbi:hypothetical protein WL58_06450 [Burkholderia cepacia]|nr:hypothetical protein WL58_06450 [Burkholderia cepacia]